jgi:DNA-binding transcriptional LysR family regulator
VSKHITQLEKSIGSRLLNRTTRALSLTEAGAALYDHAARILEELEEAKLAVSRLQTTPRGILRISAPVAFGRLHVASALPQFLVAYPELKIDMVTTDRFVDLAEEGYDVVVRIVGDPPPNVVARKLAPVNRRICATPEYFARHGLPKTPRDLENHNCLTYTYFNPQDPWRLRGPEGDISVRASGDLRVNDDDALAEAVLGGLGIALLPTFIIGRDLQAGRLQAVLSAYVPLERHIFAIYLANRHLSAKVRAFIDFFLARIGSEPYWDRADSPGLNA